MSKLNTYYGDEVYVLCADEDQETSGPLRVFDRLSQLQAHMTKLNVARANQLRVIHGILTPAEFLPSSLRGKTPYLVVQNVDDADKGMVFEATSSTVEDLAADIQSVLLNAATYAIGAEGIDDLHILWGYEISICLSVDEDDIDEEALDGCIAISAEVKEIGEGVLE
jgi:hypothetical protein